MGLGKDYILHSCIDFIIQDLDKYPDKGEKIIMTALKSPVTRNRNMAYIKKGKLIGQRVGRPVLITEESIKNFLKGVEV
jgi:hypothetical protein